MKENESRCSIRLSKRRKCLYAVCTVVLFLVAAETILALAGFQNTYARRDPFVGFSKTSRLFLVDSVGGVQVYRTSQAKLPFFNSQVFPKEKPHNTKRIFCLGGSTTFGRPFDDRTSYVNWMRRSLPELDGSVSWEVINAGGISYASYRLLNLMEELILYEPDFFIIYTGHNEFLEKRTYNQSQLDSDAAIHYLDPLFRMRLVGLCDLVVSYLQGESAEFVADSSHQSLDHGLKTEVDTMLDHSVGPDAYTRDPIYEQNVLEHFGSNLRGMVSLAKSRGAKIIFITPASNLKDFSPFKSESLVELSPPDEDQWLRHCLAAKDFYQVGEINRAEEELAAAEIIDSTRADFQFLKGKVLFDQGEYSAAHQCFERAIENDICPLRAKRAICELVSTVAIEHAIPLVDFRSILEFDCNHFWGHACCGREYFLDHVHPSVSSHRLLASSCLDAMKASGWLRFQQSEKERVLDSVGGMIDASVNPPLQAKALTNLAQVLSWAGKQEEAAPLAAKAVEIQESIGHADPEAIFYAAVQYAVVGQDEKAISMLQDFLQLVPEDFEASWRLASLLYDQGAFEIAAKHYRQASRANPSDLNTQRMLGFSLLRGGKVDEAAQVFRSYLKLVPDDEAVVDELKQLSETSEIGDNVSSDNVSSD